MGEQFEEDLEIERKARRNRRVEEMRRRKKQQNRIRKWLRIGLPVAAGVLVLAGVMIVRNVGKNVRAQSDEVLAQGDGGSSVSRADAAAMEGADGLAADSDALAGSGVAAESSMENGDLSYYAEETGDTKKLGEEIVSSYAVMIDTENHRIAAEKNARVRMNPASMTKVLTLLVAVEHIDNLEDTFTITQEITDYSFVNGCSNAGFEKNETVTVEDLLYGTILPSGAEAAVGLATYVAGSQEAFVEMMNQKLEELGLSDSAHFTNCVGIYDEDHYCTAYDMAVIMEAAVDNELCRQVLSSRTFNTSETEEHPEGLLLSNWFLRRIEDKDVGERVLGGKTGYVDQSGSCAASYGVDGNGKRYICVTANAGSKWLCINDHAELYRQFAM